MRSLISILFILCPLLASTQKTSISGIAKGYENEKLVFYEYIERLIHTKSEVFSITPDQKGEFNSVFSLNETKFLFTEYEACIYYFYAEPGKNYNIEFPAPTPKTPEQQANPFFIPFSIHLNASTKNNNTHIACTELNDAIRKFNDAFEPFYSEQILRYYSTIKNRERLDSFKLSKNIHEPVCNSQFFEEYSYYKMGSLEFVVNQFDLNKIILDYFSGKPALLSNPAWWLLFDKVYEKYFSLVSNKPDFQNLYRHIASSDFSSLNNLLKKDAGLQNDTIRELVMIRELNNEFFEGAFSQTVIVAILDSIAEKSDVKICKDLAENVKRKNTRLIPGSESPLFHVIEASGNIYELEDFRGKYVYLGFCNPNSLNCMKEFEYLRYLDEKHNKYLSIITVFEGIPPGELKKVKADNNYTWYFSSNTSRGAVYRDFNVRATPQFFLIGPDGVLLLSPAPIPSEGFERTLFSIMRNRGDL